MLRQGCALPWARLFPAFFLVSLPAQLPVSYNSYSGFGGGSRLCTSHGDFPLVLKKAKGQSSFYQERCLRDWPLSTLTFEDTSQMSCHFMTISPIANQALAPLQHTHFTFFMISIRLLMLGP